MTVERRIILCNLQEKMKGREAFCKEIGVRDTTKALSEKSESYCRSNPQLFRGGRKI